jgi:predicted CopG family antitoxin
MLRKTITVQDEIYNSLDFENYNSFSEIVGIALKLLLEKEREERYKKAILEASKDPLYISDMKEINDDFKYIDTEIE